MSKRYLVTGGTGFLGQHLVRQILEAGDEVLVLARGRDAALAKIGAEFMAGSVLSADSCAEACKGIDGVYHLAGKVDWNPRRTHTLHRLHVTGTKNVIDAAGAAGVKRVVVASTSGTVGVTKDPLEVPNDDSAFATEIVQDWPYYLSKVYAEKTALAAARSAGVEVVLMRPTLLLGPGDLRRSSTQTVVDFLDGKIPFVPSGGMSFVDVRDTATAFRTAMDRGRPGASYLLGSANLTVEAFFERLESISGVRRPLLSVPDQIALTGARLVDSAMRAIGREPDIDPVSVELAQHFWYIDWSRALKDLDFAPRDPGQTLYDTVQWLRANPTVHPPSSVRGTPFAPDAEWSNDQEYRDAVFAEPTHDAYGHRVGPPVAHEPETNSTTGQSKLVYDEYNNDGPGLDSLVASSLGRVLKGALGSRKKKGDVRARLDNLLSNASDAELQAVLEYVQSLVGT